MKMYWLLVCNSKLSVHNKLILYKRVICPVWSYGIQLWGCASDSNIAVIQQYQNKVLKCIVIASWYVRNSDHHDLRIERVTDIIAKFANSHEKRLQKRINTEASRLLNMNNITRQLKRKKRFELVKC
jgi:predicted GNAT family acetyltransferase